MNTGAGGQHDLTNYRDYEQILVKLAAERSWQFEFAGEAIPAHSVFNQAMYAPALLTAAAVEMQARQIPCDLGIEVGGEPNSLFGAKVSFALDRNSIQAQIMRIGVTAMMIEALPRNPSNENVICLDLLQNVFGDEYAHYVSQSKEAD